MNGLGFSWVIFCCLLLSPGSEKIRVNFTVILLQDQARAVPSKCDGKEVHLCKSGRRFWKWHISCYTRALNKAVNEKVERKYRGAHAPRSKTRPEKLDVPGSIGFREIRAAGTGGTGGARDRLGGTGSFGKHFCKVMREKYHPRVIRIYSRDELKQFEMRQKFGEKGLRYFIGDVRDRDRLRRAMEGADIVIHAAALKQVPACEYNPIEAVKTNINGAQNVIDAAIDAGVKKVVALSMANDSGGIAYE